MSLKSIFKYFSRFVFLQLLLTYIINFYFSNFLIPLGDLFPNQKGYTFRDQINANLLEDARRFVPFLNENFISLDFFIFGFVLVFLLFLYSTNFYTYVNELTYSLDRNYLGEYFSIYLVWTSSLMIFVTMFRFSNLISRGYLLLLTFLIPIILLLFRNAEFLSSLIGRPVTSEKYLTINLKDDSIFRNLRIMTFRKSINNIDIEDLNNYSKVINLIDRINKEYDLNLVVLNFDDQKKINEQLEDYLINLNKKVLIISKSTIQFNNYFISRREKLSGYNLTYFNNDIQYGSKYILKRILDVIMSLLAIILFFPIFMLISLYLFMLDGSPVILKQERIGLHGKSFTMFKFRTMKKNAYELRDELREQNKNDAEIFKIENDPRIINGALFLRNFSLDELPQFFNVLIGNMSIVGPRPLFSEDTQLFNEKYMRRLNVLPGITGLLQIKDRNTSDFSTWYKYDIEYIENWSLFLDLQIILKTPYSLVNKKFKGL